MEKIQNFLLRIVVFHTVVIFLFTSCEKEKNTDIPGDYYIKSELIKEYTSEQVKNLMILGEVLYPEITALVPDISSGVKFYRISYNTIFRGEEITASGLMCIPDTEGNYPFLSFQNGTNTCHSNAPTVNTNNTLFNLIGTMSSHGYIITIPDYIGFGDSESLLHPYHHKESSNSAIINLMKAAEELISIKGFNAKFDGRIFMMGYSQGGWATLNAVKELELTANKDFSPLAAACGAGAYDLMEMSKYLLNQEQYNTPHYLPYFIESRRQNGILDEPLSLFFNQPYAGSIPGLFDGNSCNTSINKELTNSISELLTSNMIENFEDGADFQNLRTELTSNSATAWNTNLKLKFYHSVGDSSVPSTQSDKIYKNFLDKGVSSELLLLKITQDSTIGHSDAIVPWGIDALLWLNSIR